MTSIRIARDYAHEAHDAIKQKRKYTHEPYWVHTDEVAVTVATVTHDSEIIIASHLHDVIEDVYPYRPEYSLGAIQLIFGQTVANLVHELTDVYTSDKHPHLNRKTRKHLERVRLGNCSPEAKTVKLADLISNTKSIVAHDPDFARTYLREKWDLLPQLSEGSPYLFQIAKNQTIAGFAALGLDTPAPPVRVCARL